MNARILITDKAHPILRETLTNAGFEVNYRPDISYEDFKSSLDQYEGVIINSKTPMQAENIRLGKKLKFIGRLGSGLDIIDQEEADKQGVAVLNAPEGNANAVAEHALGMLLSLLNNLCRSDREVRSFIWNRENNRGMELSGKTIGVIGYGNNGSAFVEKLAGLNVKVLAFDKYRKRYGSDIRYLTESKLEKVLSASDVLSLHIPLNEETHHMVDEDFLGKMKKGAILINTSRGKIVKTRALIGALQSGQLGGACLDVIENEKVGSYSIEEKEMYDRLFAFSNVHVSPHIAGWTKESLEKIAQVLASKILEAY